MPAMVRPSIGTRANNPYSAIDSDRARRDNGDPDKLVPAIKK